jgi:hypothetical protein
MEDKNNIPSELNVGKKPVDKVRSAIMTVLTHALIPIAFIGFSLCAIPAFAQKLAQFNIAPDDKLLRLFNISELINEHVYFCLGLLYLALCLDAAVYLALFHMKKRAIAGFWSWVIIITETSLIIFCVWTLYGSLQTLTLLMR